MLLQAVGHQQLIASSWGLTWSDMQWSAFPLQDAFLLQDEHAAEGDWLGPRREAGSGTARALPVGFPAQLHRESRRPRGRKAPLKPPAAQQQ
jgi:hypothetical protein